MLIIEDEQVLARSLMRALKSAGHEARVASTGLEGAEAVRASVPDLVLLDLRLPDGSGLDVLAELHGIDPSISIVLMTAYGSVQDAVEAMRRGAVAR